MPVYIPTQSAAALVAPYALQDVLLCLKETGLITHFKINENLTRVETADRKRFEISSFMSEMSDFKNISRPQRRPRP